MRIGSLRVLEEREPNDLIVTAIKERAVNGSLNILEAGCGRKWPFDLKGIEYKLTGVDLDQAALEVRKARERDLHEAILGDLRSVALPASAYDVIYNSYVLEHIDGAEQVLRNFLRWLKPGGLIILTIPDQDSAYGFIAKYTPFWFHVFFYRYIIGARNAGKPGHAPYPTYYDSVVSRAGIRKFVEDNSLRIVAECGFYRPPGKVGTLTDLVRLVSFGRLPSSHSNLLFIISTPDP